MTVSGEFLWPPMGKFKWPLTADEPIFGREVVFEWHVKRWRCPNQRCETDTWDEELPPVGSAQWRQGAE